MKTTLKIIKTNDRGFTLTELLIVLVILSALLAIAAIPAKQWLDKYNAESQLRTMHADLLQARTKAMEKNMMYFVVVAANNYQIVEDANGNGVNDDPVLNQTPLRYPATSPVTLIIDQKGLVSTSTSTFSNLPDIFFNTANVTPQYDCLHLYATRINIGKKDGGGKCVAQ